MKVKVLTMALGSLFAASAMADNITQAQQAQINQLQSQINTLKGDLSNSVTNNTNLSIVGESATKSINSDFDSPFGELPDTSLSYTLLQEQSQFKSPLSIGGYLEGDFQWWGGNNIASTNTIVNGAGGTYNQKGTNFALTSAKLYFLANLNDWTQAFMTIKGGLNGSTTTFAEAFLNFGNLSKSPLYATIGQTYTPFGSFNSGNGPWSNDLLTNAFRSGELPQVIFGYGKNGLNSSISLSNGKTNLSTFIYDLNYEATVNNFNYNVGGSYTNDIRNSLSGIGSAYAANGAAASSASPITGGRNGALIFNSNVGYNLGNNQGLGLYGEWATTTASGYNGPTPTGKMSAWDVAGTFATPVVSLPTTFGLSYSQTHNMQYVPLALNGNAATGTAEIVGIQNEWLVFASSEVRPNLYVGPEYARQKLYNGAYAWTGTVDLSYYF